MAERLQKIIAASGVMSRRAAEEAISAGRVCLNGKIAVLGERAEYGDSILLDNHPIPSAEPKRYYMLNKPRGYVCSLNDEKVGAILRFTDTELESSLKFVQTHALQTCY